MGLSGAAILTVGAQAVKKSMQSIMVNQFIRIIVPCSKMNIAEESVSSSMVLCASAVPARLLGFYYNEDCGEEKEYSALYSGSGGQVCWFSVVDFVLLFGY